jgi:glycosyltransferase involved in cell wall biosynthesis
VTTNQGPAYERQKWGGLAKLLIRSVEGLSVRGATAATAAARNQAESLSRRYRRAIAYIPNGIEPSEEIRESEARDFLQSHGLTPDAFWLFAAARIDPTKGCHTLLTAYRTLRDPAPLMVLGDLGHAPGYEEKLRAMAEGLDVRFVPRIEDKALLLGILRLTGLFVFPSAVEAMSLMLLEALTVGAPLIASDIPENLAVLPERSDTFSVEDPSDLARAIDRFLATPLEDRLRKSRARAEWVRSNFSWDSIAERYEAVYAQALRGRRP